MTNKQITPTAYRSVSDFRREQLAGEVDKGSYKGKDASDGPSHLSYAVAGSGNLYKSSQYVSSSAANSFKGVAGNSLAQLPESYSPLWLNSNLNLPRDRATMNAWCRSFYALNPIVQNAINLHSTYPISKINIKCPDKRVEKHFADMIEETDLMNVCSQVAQEYWLLGEAIVYADLDERNATWARFHIQNPDYIVMQRSVIAQEPVIMLRPDENLRRICISNLPADVAQRKQLDETIIHYVRKGQNIPLDNLYVSHLARRISPYELRGTGLPVSIFRSLMLFDQLKECKFSQASDMVNPMRIIKIGGGAADFRANPADLDAWRAVWECHDSETEVLTDQGFKKYNEIMSFNEINNNIKDVKPNNSFKIACFNPKNDELEYHTPTNAHLYNYTGDMYHFHNKKIDIKVSPNHRMWASTREVFYYGSSESREAKWSNWRLVEAKDLKMSYSHKFRSEVNWKGNDDIKYVNISGKDVPVELYLEFLGYLLSEGCLYTDEKYKFTVEYCQSIPKFYEEMKLCAENFGKIIDVNCYETVKNNSLLNKGWSDTASFKFNDKALYNHFLSAIGTNGNTTSAFKKIPGWVKELSPRLLKILIKSLRMGDGSFTSNNDGTQGSAYFTTSEQLANDVYEIVFKSGDTPVLSHHDDKRVIKSGKRKKLYKIHWSSNKNGRFPLVNKYSTNSRTKEKTSNFNIEKYDGKIWCLTVPTGLFITRRNGKITIQGNSATSDKNFKIFTHDAVTVETLGAGSGIYDTTGDFAQLFKEMYAGLMIPQVIIEGGGDITYANGGISLEVLRQRYMQFRNMMSTWLRRKIFQPISKLNEFYEYVDGEKRLIIPDVDWNHMSLFDLDSYVQTLRELTGEQKRVSIHTLYRSLGLEWEEERRRIRQEDIAEAIREKEKASLGRMNLNDLRTLDEEDEIPELLDTPLPGQSPYEESSGGGDEDKGGLPGLEPPPSGPPAESPPAP